MVVASAAVAAAAAAIAATSTTGKVSSRILDTALDVTASAGVVSDRARLLLAYAFYAAFIAFDESNRYASYLALYPEDENTDESTDDSDSVTAQAGSCLPRQGEPTNILGLTHKILALEKIIRHSTFPKNVEVTYKVVQKKSGQQGSFGMKTVNETDQTDPKFYAKLQRMYEAVLVVADFAENFNLAVHVHVHISGYNRWKHGTFRPL